jgi:A/G-specific adenine glycosylase
MLQQTQVKTVIPYYERWMRALPTIADFATARPERVLKLWEGLGYYRRVRLAQDAARRIMKEYSGRFPESFEQVLALPGVGRYTAGAICSIAFNQPTAILDGNVIRVLSRLLAVGSDPRSKPVNQKLWQAAEALVLASGDPSRLNQAMMELGALVCLPRQPRCPACPLRADCLALRQQRVEDYPGTTRRAKATQRRFIALVVRDGERLLVRQRRANAVNAGLWEFPNVEVAVNTKNLRPLVAPFELLSLTPFFRVRHSITSSRILLEAYHAQLDGRAPSSGAVWKTPAQLKKLPFTSAHRKLLHHATACAIRNDAADSQRKEADAKAQRKEAELTR